MCNPKENRAETQIHSEVRVRCGVACIFTAALYEEYLYAAHGFEISELQAYKKFLSPV